jgi:hypothetical protein
MCLALMSLAGAFGAAAQTCPSPFGTGWTGADGSSTGGQLWPWASWMEYHHVEFTDALPDSFHDSGGTHLPLGRHDIQCRVTDRPPQLPAACRHVPTHSPRPQLIY